MNGKSYFSAKIDKVPEALGVAMQLANDLGLKGYVIDSVRGPYTDEVELVWRIDLRKAPDVMTTAKPKG